MIPPDAPETATPTQARTPQQAALVEAASAWTARLARTLKSCRLYDRGNPTVLRLREELSDSLVRLLEEHGPLTLRCTSSDVFCGEASVYPARSREDNLGMPFFRDGIRNVLFLPGVAPREVDALVDALLLVTGRNGGDADLVTLLWDAELAHVSTEAVTTEMPLEGENGETGGADAGGGDAGSSLMPWPGTNSGAGPAPGAGSGPEAGGGAAPAPGAGAECCTSRGGVATEAEPSRSDDWAAEEPSGRSGLALADLEAAGPREMERLRAEFEAERATGPLQNALELVCQCLEAETAPDEHDELGRFLLRLLNEALVAGAWPEARRTAGLLTGRTGGGAAIATLLGELCQPDSLTTSYVIQAVDGQGARGVQEFLALARDLGPRRWTG